MTEEERRLRSMQNIELLRDFYITMQTAASKGEEPHLPQDEMEEMATRFCYYMLTDKIPPFEDRKKMRELTNEEDDE